MGEEPLLVLRALKGVPTVCCCGLRSRDPEALLSEKTSGRCTACQAKMGVLTEVLTDGKEGFLWSSCLLSSFESK